MKWKFALLAILISANSFAQKIKLNSDSVLAHNAFAELEVMATKLHSLVMKGDLKAYKSDSLKSYWQVSKIGQYLPKNKHWFEGFSIVMTQEGSLSDLTKTSSPKALAPMYKLIIEEQDLGIYPMYFLDFKEIEKVFKKQDLAPLPIYINLLAGLLPKYSAVEHAKEEYLTNNHYSQVWDNALGKSRVLITDWSLKLAFGVSKSYLGVALENACSNHSGLKLYTNIKMQKEINLQEAFTTTETIQIPRNNGQMSDTVILLQRSFDQLSNMNIAGDSVSFTVDNQTVYAKRSEVEAVVPKWIFVLLME